MSYDRYSSRSAAGPSPTDRAAARALDAIDDSLRHSGFDPERAYAVVMVMFPDGKPTNATVAGALPGEFDTLGLLQHAVTQLRVLAAESGYAIDLTPVTS